MDMTPPPLCTDKLPAVLPWPELDWIRDIKGKVYYALWLCQPGESCIELPNGYDIYFCTFHGEPLDYEWIVAQSSKIIGKIIVLDNGTAEQTHWPENVSYYSYNAWHLMLQQILTWFPQKPHKNIQHKASVICNRITLNKLLVFTQVMECYKHKDILAKLNTWLDNPNDYGSRPDHEKLDYLYDLFFKKYYGKKITVDKFTESDNINHINSNPNNIFLTDCALHYDLETCAYSYMYENNVQHIRPGPHLSEKTFKCLLAETPFIPVGQYNIIHTLSSFGLKFDYGFSLEFDKKPENITRLAMICDLVGELCKYSISDIVGATSDSCKHNRDYIISGDFESHIKSYNDKTIEKVLYDLK